MAPADLRKEGSAYDLTLALGILTASGQIKSESMENYIIMGELSLDGSLQPIKGALPIAIKAKEEGFKAIHLSGAKYAQRLQIDPAVSMNSPSFLSDQGVFVSNADVIRNVLKEVK